MRPSLHQQPSFADLLDQHRELVELVRQDLGRGLRQPHVGRAGMTAEQTLRAFVLQRIKDWDLRELSERTADGYTVRIFTRFFSTAVPRHDAFHRAFTRLTPATVRAINDAVVQAAVAAALEDGTKLRVDTTVVETNIHYPTDATLLWDCVRVVTRLVRRLEALRPDVTPHFPNRIRWARRRMHTLQRLTPTQRETEQVTQYRALIHGTAQVVQAARAVLTAAAGAAHLAAVEQD